MRAIACGLLLYLAMSGAAAAGGLEVREPWIRAAPPAAQALAGYAELVNGGDAPLRVTGARSAGFGAVEMHEMRMDDGVMRMRALPLVEVAPHSSVRFAPGGNHLMLLRPARPLAAGDRVEIEFEIEAAAPIAAVFTVRRPD